MANSFLKKLVAAGERNQSLLCVGLDPDPSLMPVDDVFEFNRSIIDATKDLVCAYKPNVAFYEALGEAGHDALRRTLKHIPENIPVIGDSKRGDVRPSSTFHAKAMFEIWEFDAATVNPYGGHDAVEPFLDYKDRGVFVWCRSSNPGAGEIQDVMVTPPNGEEARPLYQWVAKIAEDWNEHNNVGLVVGATYPEELAAIRDLHPRMPILIPGVGAQQGSLERAVSSGVDDDGRMAIINVSRSVIYASGDRKEFAGAARISAERIREHINRYLFSTGSPWPAPSHA